MISYQTFKNFFSSETIPGEELKECEGFNAAQKHLLHRLDEDWNHTLPIKYQYDQSLRKARVVWFEHFMGPVALPTAILVFCSHKCLRNRQLRAAAIFLSFGIGAKLYMAEYSSFDINVEKTYKVLLCPTPIGKECRDILKEHDSDHWILDKYEIDAMKLRKKMANSNVGAYRQWYNRKKYCDDIFEGNADKNGMKSADKSEDDYDLELDEEIYGDTRFMAEYPLPKNELTFAPQPLAESG
eukprot:UN05413